MSAHGHHTDDGPVAQPQRPSSVDEAVQAHLDFLEGSAEWPDLSQLSDEDRSEAAELINFDADRPRGHAADHPS